MVCQRHIGDGEGRLFGRQSIWSAPKIVHKLDSELKAPPLYWEHRPLRELLRLAWPMVISLVSFSLMTLVDTLFIGWLGSAELAGAGLGGICIFTVASFGLALFGAAKVQVSQDHGERNGVAVDRALGAFLRLALLLGLGSILAGELMALVLPFVSAHEETGQKAAAYVAIRSLGLPFVMFSSALGQWLSAQGDSKSAMRAALLANFANVPLNAALIFGLELGLVGAAWATVLSRLVEVLWLFHSQGRGVVVDGSNFRPSPGFHLENASWAMASRAFRRGLPTGIERIMDMLAFTAVPILLSSLGPVHVAAHQIVLQVSLFSFLPSLAFSEALSVLVAQAVGAGRPSLVRRVSALGLVVPLFYSFFCVLLILRFSSAVASLFTPDPILIDVTSRTLAIAAAVQFINTAYTQAKGILRGLSVFRFVAWVTVLCAWSITPPLTYLLGVRAGLGAPGAWLTLCIEVTVGLLLLLLRLHFHPSMRRVSVERCSN